MNRLMLFCRMDKTEKKINFYSALFISIILNSAKLLALREGGIMARIWHFDLAEFIFQIVYNFCFCYLLLFINLKSGLWTSGIGKKNFLNSLQFIAILVLAMFAGGIFQRHFISDQTEISKLYWSGYISRFAATGLLVGILIKIILLMREGRQKGKENEQLKRAYLEAELELLKGQLNPHFLFNSLSSLSGIIREDPQLAQHYVSQLSKVFRYSLQQSGADLVTLADELAMIRSYGELLTMRFEKGFKMEIDIDKAYLNTKIPHLSLQLLLENAAKHNIATAKKPLKVNVFISDGFLTMSNNLQETVNPQNSTGIGISNLNERFKILMGKSIEIIKSDDEFMIKLPLTS